MVVQKMTWPHEVVYFVDVEHAEFEDLTIPKFVQGYLIIMKGEGGAITTLKVHLQKTMELKHPHKH